MGSCKKPQGLGPTPEHSLESPRVGPGVGWVFFFFLKLPRCFRGAAEGGNYCFIVSFGEPHIIKQYCFSVCLIIKVITCLLFKKKRSKDLDSAKIIIFSSLMCSFQIKKKILVPKNMYMFCIKYYI